MHTQARYELVGNALVEELRQQGVTLRHVETDAVYHDEAVYAGDRWLRAEVWRGEAHDGRTLFFPVYALGHGEAPARWRLLPLTGDQQDAEQRVRSLLHPVLEAVRNDDREAAIQAAEHSSDDGHGAELVRVLRDLATPDPRAVAIGGIAEMMIAELEAEAAHA